ncbi:MAG TPA: hypothetical protein PKA27_02250 [Fimbriimonadaceae bacterium]|nr:hypothetical protein [Fimbriimonadaceae bacterium]
MDGLDNALKGCFNAFLILLAVLCLAVIASFTGWQPLLRQWPYAAAYFGGVLTVALYRYLFDE